MLHNEVFSLLIEDDKFKDTLPSAVTGLLIQCTSGLRSDLPLLNESDQLNLGEFCCVWHSPGADIRSPVFFVRQVSEGPPMPGKTQAARVIWDEGTMLQRTISLTLPSISTALNSPCRSMMSAQIQQNEQKHRGGHFRTYLSLMCLLLASGRDNID